MYEYKAKVKRVIDGDTYEMIIDLGFNLDFTVDVRIIGCDAYETYGEEEDKGDKATKFAEDTLLGKELVINTEYDMTFDRYLAKVFVDGVDFSKLLIKEGHAVTR